MKLLHIIASLNPSHGGPVEALRQFSIALVGLGCDSKVITLDAPDAPWLKEFPGTVYALGPSLSKYYYNRHLLPWLCGHVQAYDAVIVHGIWQYLSLAVWRASRQQSFQYFVFTHGALDTWFKRKYPLKHLKKWIYWLWGGYRMMRDATAVLYTSEDERLLARKSFWLYKANELLVDLGIEEPKGDAIMQREVFLNSYPHLRGKRILLFLSRIHEKKGCDLLIRAFVQIAKGYSDLHLVMAGPDQDSWKDKLEKLAASTGMSERITWTGMIHDDLKWGAFHSAEAFILPSHSENFGIVVAEALACGVPVLITDKINIWREVLAEEAGFVTTDTLEGTLSHIEQWLTLDADSRENFSRKARACFYKHFEIKKATQSLINAIEYGVKKQRCRVA